MLDAELCVAARRQPRSTAHTLRRVPSWSRFVCRRSRAPFDCQRGLASSSVTPWYPPGSCRLRIHTRRSIASSFSSNDARVPAPRPFLGPPARPRHRVWQKALPKPFRSDSSRPTIASASQARHATAQYGETGQVFLPVPAQWGWRSSYCGKPLREISSTPECGRLRHHRRGSNLAARHPIRHDPIPCPLAPGSDPLPILPVLSAELWPPVRLTAWRGPHRSSLIFALFVAAPRTLSLPRSTGADAPAPGAALYRKRNRLHSPPAATLLARVSARRESWPV